MDFSGFKKGKIIYMIRFSDYYDKIDRVALSFGDVVSGGNQTNKANYHYKPKKNDWQEVLFDIDEPDSVTGTLNFEDIKRIRFNIEYGQEFKDTNSTFNVFIDNIILTKQNKYFMLLLMLGIISFIFCIIFLSWSIISKRTARYFYILLFEKRQRKETVKETINYIFQFLLVIFLLLLLINEFNKITFVNLNYMLIAVIVFGVLSVLFPEKKVHEVKKATKKDYIFIYLLGILGVILIFIKTKQLGWLSYVISIVGGILIILLSHLVIDDDEKNN